MRAMNERKQYTPGHIQDLGSIAGLTRDQSSGAQSDVILTASIFGHQINIPIGDSASSPTIVDIGTFPRPRR